MRALLSVHRARGLRVSPQQRHHLSRTSSTQERLSSSAKPSLDSLKAPRSSNLVQWGPPGLKKRAYILPMFPYPSGTLHLGHLRVYTISDVLARFRHMQGYRVLHPIGWDAFGLPAENAALERGVHPEKWTMQNIETMKSQMKEMGGKWDWSKEIRTCDPDFYKHTQRLFLMLYERGLAYQAESLVNYDPVDQTVLANEQVDANGCSWRSGAKVEKIKLKQWFLKIKEFQEPLLKDLDGLAEQGRWPERVLAMQKNWIGRSEGTKLWFDMQSTTDSASYDPVEVFTTRADTLFGVQYIALSLNHPIVSSHAANDDRLRAFLERAKDLPPDSKKGYLLPHVTALNPLAHITGSDITDSQLPVYVAPYVLDDYGSGAVMGVPGHDARDHAFWRANAADKSIRVVISADKGASATTLNTDSLDDQPFLEKGFVATHLGDFSGLASDEASEQIVRRLRDAGKPAELTANWRLRDWLISRQRYWGTPIPMVHCNSCGSMPVSSSELPVKLPDLPDSFFQGRQGNPLAQDEEWKKTKCPKCGSDAERETDTMDTFMDSSWYFFRFLDPSNKLVPVGPSAANDFMPVDVYVGGVEHAILHLLYARFISKFLATTEFWPKGKAVNGEPFKKLITQGMVHGKTYSDPVTGRFLHPAEINLDNPSVPIIRSSGLAPYVSYEKMSKSRHNGVDPSKTIANYGADATRAHMLFQAPVSEVLEWDEDKIKGVQRWLTRILKLSNAYQYPDMNLRVSIRSKPNPFEYDVDFYEYLQTLQTLKILKHKELMNRPSPYQTKEEALLACLKPEEKALWSQTQETLASVTQSYSETYSLNTVISDLMTLTNAIGSTRQASEATPYLKWLSMVHLLRMLAPIAPDTAEKGWRALHDGNNLSIRMPESRLKDNRGVPSIFKCGFPTADVDLIPKLNPQITCVFQVNGKRKFETKIKKLDEEMTTAHSTNKLSTLVLDSLVETDEGKEWLDRETGKLWKASESKKASDLHQAVPDEWRVVVAKKGAILNLVDKDARSNRKAARKARKEESNVDSLEGS